MPRWGSCEPNEPGRPARRAVWSALQFGAKLRQLGRLLCARPHGGGGADPEQAKARGGGTRTRAPLSDAASGARSAPRSAWGVSSATEAADEEAGACVAWLRRAFGCEDPEECPP